MHVEIKDGITKEQLDFLYADPYIQKVGYDNYPAKPIHHPNVSYLSALVNNEFAGAFILVKHSISELELHALLLKKFVKQSRELGKLCISYAFSKILINRITVNVSSNLNTAKNYVTKLGFKLEGVKREVGYKNGLPFNVYMFGILRKEWA